MKKVNFLRKNLDGVAMMMLMTSTSMTWEGDPPIQTSSFSIWLLRHVLTFRRLWTCPTSPGNVPRRGKIQRPSWSSCWVIGRRAGQFWRPCTSIRPYCLFKRNLCTLALLSLFRPYVLTIDKQLNVISKGNCQARFNEKRQGLWHTIDINADKLKDNENIAHFLKHKNVTISYMSVL